MNKYNRVVHAALFDHWTTGELFDLKYHIEGKEEQNQYDIRTLEVLEVVLSKR